MPFGVILGCYTICPFLVFFIRGLLARENKRRDNERVGEKDGYDNAYIEEEKDGVKVRKLVDKVCTILYLITMDSCEPY